MNLPRARAWIAVFVLAVVAGGILWQFRAKSSKTATRIGARPPNGSRYPQVEGEAIFRAICQGCHMADARGAIGAGAYPSLAHNERLGAKEYATFMVVRGRRGMPPFGNDLDDAQVAAVVNYVRTHFGNDYRDEVRPGDVAANR